MSDKFKRENQTLKIAAQAAGKLKKAPQPQQQQGQGRPRQQQQGDAFGTVGDKPEPVRVKREITTL